MPWKRSYAGAEIASGYIKIIEIAKGSTGLCGELLKAVVDLEEVQGAQYGSSWDRQDGNSIERLGEPHFGEERYEE